MCSIETKMATRVYEELTSITGIRSLIDNTGEDVDEEEKDGDEKSSPGRVRSRGKKEEDPGGDHNEDSGDIVEGDVLLPLAEHLQLDTHNGVENSWILDTLGDSVRTSQVRGLYAVVKGFQVNQRRRVIFFIWEEVNLAVGLGKATQLKIAILLMERKICELGIANDDNCGFKTIVNIYHRTIPFEG